MIERLHCCEPDCPRDAEFEILPMPPCDPYDYTFACAVHISELLGSVTDREPSHYQLWPLDAAGMSTHVCCQGTPWG